MCIEMKTLVKFEQQHWKIASLMSPVYGAISDYIVRIVLNMNLSLKKTKNLTLSILCSRKTVLYDMPAMK